MNDNTAVIAAEIVVFIKANDKIRGIYWTAKNIAGHGFSVPADKIVGGKGEIEEGSYFPTVAEINAAMKTLPGYHGSDRTVSGRGAFGRLGGSGLRSKYHPAYVTILGGSPKRYGVEESQMNRTPQKYLGHVP